MDTGSFLGPNSNPSTLTAISGQIPHRAYGPPPVVGGYKLIEPVGGGGMGVVWKAVQLRLNRIVAIKTLRSPDDLEPRDLVRFLGEAEAAAAVRHPNVVQVFEAGGADGQPYLAMEYLPGGSLAERLKAGEQLDPRAAASLVGKVARGVQASHDLGIIHRDLKPSNILFDAVGEPKVTDFGLAKRGLGSDLTRTQAIMGTPAYMPPEQASGRTKYVTAAADVWAMGVILYECLTGARPFDGLDHWQTLHNLQSLDSPAPGLLNKAVPRDLDLICLKCLAKEPVKRYPSAGVMAEDLDRFLAGEPVSVREAGWSERVFKLARRNPGWTAATVATVLAMILITVGSVIAAIMFNEQRKTTEANLHRAQTAERKVREELYQSLISEVQFRLSIRRVGQRFRTLEVIRQAVALARELEKPAGDFSKLRNLAISALALPDLRAVDEWMTEPDEPDWNSLWRASDPHLRWHAVSDQRTGAVSLRRIGSNPSESGEIARFPGPGGETEMISSPDGQYLAIIGGRLGKERLQVWKVDIPKPTLSVEIPSGEMPSACIGVAFLMDNRIVTIHRNGLLRISKPNNGEEICSIPSPVTDVSALVCHPRLPLVALAGPSELVVLDLDKAIPAKSIRLATQYHQLAWHPDGELIAAASNEGLEVLDVVQGRILWSKEDRLGLFGIAFNLHGDLLMSYGYSNRTHFWSPYTGQEIFSTSGTATRQFGSDNRLLMSDYSQQLKIQQLSQVTNGRECRLLVAGRFSKASNCIKAEVHPGGRLLAVATLSGLSFMDLQTGSERLFLPLNCESLLFEPSGALITSSQGGVYRWPVTADSRKIRIGPPQRLPLPRIAPIVQTADGTTLAAAAWGGQEPLFGTRTIQPNSSGFKSMPTADRWRSARMDR